MRPGADRPVRCALVWSALERTRTVSAPDARIWTVRRVMAARMSAPDRAGADGATASDPGSSAARFEGPIDPGELARMVVVVVIAVAILFMVLAPLLPFLVDVVVVLLGAAAAVAARLLFRRPWRVEATATVPPERIAWGVVGTRASAAAVDAVARDIARGVAVADLRPGIPLTS
jgi:hypothetical protein